MTKQKHPYKAAVAVAKELVDILRPFSLPTPDHMKPYWPHDHLMVVAGSLRRAKPEVSDVEIVYVPRTEERSIDMFNKADVDLLHEQADRMRESNVLAQRPNVKGGFTWGPKNKFAIHVKSGIPVDLFATTVENFWVTLVIRTGSKEMNLKLTTGANRLGATLNAYGCGITQSDGTIVPAMSERHVFDLCGVKYLEARDR